MPEEMPAPPQSWDDVAENFSDTYSAAVIAAIDSAICEREVVAANLSNTVINNKAPNKNAPLMASNFAHASRSQQIEPYTEIATRIVRLLPFFVNPDAVYEYQDADTAEGKSIGWRRFPIFYNPRTFFTDDVMRGIFQSPHAGMLALNTNGRDMSLKAFFEGCRACLNKLRYTRMDAAYNIANPSFAYIHYDGAYLGSFEAVFNDVQNAYVNANRGEVRFTNAIIPRSDSYELIRFYYRQNNELEWEKFTIHRVQSVQNTGIKIKNNTRMACDLIPVIVPTSGTASDVENNIPLLPDEPNDVAPVRNRFSTFSAGYELGFNFEARTRIKEGVSRLTYLSKRHPILQDMDRTVYSGAPSEGDLPAFSPPNVGAGSVAAWSANWVFGYEFRGMLDWFVEGGFKFKQQS